MQQADEEQLRGAPAPPRGRVNQVRSNWLVHEDGALAHKLQEQEFGDKYHFNRSERQTARQDVPMARVCESEEEERLQRERMEHLMQMRQLSENDEVIAKQVQDLEMSKMTLAQQRSENDEVIAKQVQDLEMSKMTLAQQRSQEDEEVAQRVYAAEQLDTRRETEDSIVAQQFQTEEMLRNEQERVRREIADKDYALMLQEKERKRYERKRREHELKHEKRRLQETSAREAEQLLGRMPSKDPSIRSPPADQDQNAQRSPVADNDSSLERDMGDLSVADSRKVREDGRLEDAGDFTDFYIPPDSRMNIGERKELQELQDQELARLLQDQERRRGATVDREKLQSIEARDAELARVMQEQEKLKKQRHHHHHKNRQGNQQRNGQHGNHRSPASNGHEEPLQDQVDNLANEAAHEHQSLHRPRSPVDPTNDTYLQPRSAQPPSSQAGMDYGSRRGAPPSQSSPDYAGRGMGPLPDHYQSRPLPDTPGDVGHSNPHRPTHGANRGRHSSDSPPASPLPSYRPPPEYHHDSQASPPTHRSGHSPQPDGNLFATIDPTYGGSMTSEHSQHSNNTGPRTPEGSLQRNMSPVEAHQERTPPTTLQSRGGEEKYCNLDDFGPVQGHKRSSLQRSKGARSDSSKRGSCKQQ